METINHYGHNVDSTGPTPYCTDCDLPVGPSGETFILGKNDHNEPIVEILSAEARREFYENARLYDLRSYSDTELKDELARRDREHDHRAPMEVSL